MSTHHGLRIEPVRLAEVTLPAGHPLASSAGSVPCPVYAFLVRHPDGAVLVDTGIGEHEGIERLYRPVRRPLAGELEERGISISDIVTVVNTHLHFDHCGQNALFPSVPIFVQAAEYQAAQKPLYTVREWVDAPGLHYEQVSGDVEPLPGLHVLATPGHTPGHQSVLVDGTDGPVLIAGHAAYDIDEFAGRRYLEQENAWDAAQYRASLQRLRELRAVRTYFSHDDNAWTANDAVGKEDA